MPTSSPELARTAVVALGEAGIGYAVLHGADHLERGAAFGDVDLVVDRSGTDVVSAVRGIWWEKGLFPLALWPYDVGGGASIFLSDHDASRGAQLDLLHDPQGNGRYGLRSGAFKIVKSPIPSVSASDRLVYLWAKRLIKGPIAALEELRISARQEPIAFAEAVDRLVAHPAVAASVSAHVSWPDATARLVRRYVQQFGRVAGRLRQPVGFWAHVGGRSIAEALVVRFGRILGSSAAGIVPKGVVPRSRWIATSVAPVRWRPGVFVSYGGLARGISPDLVAIEGTIDQVASAIVRAMSERLAARTSRAKIHLS